MSLETRIMRAIIGWLWGRYPYLMRDIVVGPDKHLRRNPRRRGKA